MKKYLILENIRSVHNVGAIFRTADAIGVDKVYCVGYTPVPIDRFGRKRSDLHKAALGAEESVEWEKIDDVSKLIEKLKEEGFDVLALEQSDKSVDYKSHEVKKDTAVILGNETEGVDESTLKMVDHILEIPMRGEKESLNVSVATGVVLYRLFD